MCSGYSKVRVFALISGWYSWTMLSYLYLAVALFLILYYYVTRNFDHWKKKNVPFVKPLPFVGNVIDGVLMRQSFGEFFHQLYQKSAQPILGLFMLDQPCLLIRDPKIAQRILINDFQHFYDRNVLNNKRDDPIGTHILFFLKNPLWKEIRSKISPVFTSSKMRLMSQLIEDAAKDMTAYVEKQIKNDPILEMKEICVRFTVDVITSTAFGVNADSFNQKDSQFLVEAKRMVDWNDFMTGFRLRCYFLAHTLVKMFRMKLFNPVSIKFLEESFWDIMDQRSTSKNNRKDLIDILLQLNKDDKNFLEGDLLVSQAVIFFAAGFETSSSTISFALHELAHHPEIQKKLRKEINEVSQKHGGINYDALKEMGFMDMCVKEVLRKFPILPVLERQTANSYTIPETGTVLDKGTPVFISAYGIHHDPEYYPDPDNFDPERFSEENQRKMQSCTFLAFGEGPRNCIGARFGTMTVKYGLAHLVQNFSIETCAQSPEKLEFNKNGLTLSAVHGIHLKVTKI